jgi:FkbH-like protein
LSGGRLRAVTFTAEDRQRAGLYAADTERGALLEASQSMDDFLRGLKMSVVHGPFTPIDLARVVQLINKTNQFNTTTRRYTSEVVASIVGSATAVTLQFRLLDRFGDNDLVSAMILRPQCRAARGA